MLHANDAILSDAKATDIEDADGELQEAIDEMNRLDTILAALQVKEQQLKLQGKEMKKQLWGELMVCTTIVVVAEIKLLIKYHSYHASTTLNY